MTPHPLLPSRTETGVSTQFPKQFLSLQRQEPGTDFFTLIACTRKIRGRGRGSGGGKGWLCNTLSAEPKRKRKQNDKKTIHVLNIGSRQPSFPRNWVASWWLGAPSHSFHVLRCPSKPQSPSRSSQIIFVRTEFFKNTRTKSRKVNKDASHFGGGRRLSACSGVGKDGTTTPEEDGDGGGNGVRWGGTSPRETQSSKFKVQTLV